MSEPKRIVPGVPDPVADTRDTALNDFLDLSKVETRSKSLVGSQLSIRRGYRGLSTIEGADTVKISATQQNLDSPLAAALAIYSIKDDAMAFHGVPTMNDSPSHLSLTWTEAGDLFACDMRKLLELKKIRIPRGTRMVIEISPDTHEKHGPCVKFSWNAESFVRIIPRKQSEPNR